MCQVSHTRPMMIDCNILDMHTRHSMIGCNVFGLSFFKCQEYYSVTMHAVLPMFSWITNDIQVYFSLRACL